MTIFGQKPWTNHFEKVSIFWTFLKDDFSRLTRILFFPEYHKTIFPGWICPKTTNEKNGHFMFALLEMTAYLQGPKAFC